MTGTVVIVLLVVLIFLGISSLINHIPKTGRAFDANGKHVVARITNGNRFADRAVTLRAKDSDGRRYKVKMKATEAKLWIKGDEITVVLCENSKNYRVLFHDYFRSNEQRIREYALKKLQKYANPGFIAAYLTEYKKNSLDTFRASEADSRTIFLFATYMRMIDVYSVLALIVAAVFVYWYIAVKPTFFYLLIPLASVLLIFFIINSSVNLCKRVMESVNKK